MSSNGKQTQAVAVETDGVEDLRLEFDLTALTGQQYHDYVQAQRSDNIEACCKVLAQVIVDHPSGWGELHDPATYLKLPMFTTLKAVMRALTDEMKAEAGK